MAHSPFTSLSYHRTAGFSSANSKKTRLLTGISQGCSRAEKGSSDAGLCRRLSLRSSRRRLVRLLSPRGAQTAPAVIFLLRPCDRVGGGLSDSFRRAGRRQRQLSSSFCAPAQQKSRSRSGLLLLGFCVLFFSSADAMPGILSACVPRQGSDRSALLRYLHVPAFPAQIPPARRSAEDGLQRNVSASAV